MDSKQFTRAISCLLLLVGASCKPSGAQAGAPAGNTNDASTTSERVRSFFVDLGDDLRQVGEKLSEKSQEGYAAASRDARDVMKKVRQRIDDSRPEAKKMTDRTRDDLRALARKIEAGLDRMSHESGAALERTRKEVREDLEKMRAKLRETNGKDHDRWAPK